MAEAGAELEAGPGVLFQCLSNALSVSPLSAFASVSVSPQWACLTLKVAVGKSGGRVAGYSTSSTSAAYSPYSRVLSTPYKLSTFMY